MVVFRDIPKSLSLFYLRKKEKKKKKRKNLKKWEMVLRDELGWFHLDK